jgi:superfamily II DNA or RNA helicase
VIGCAEDLPQHIALPRGLRPELEGLLGRHGVALEVEDKRESGTSVRYSFQGTLTNVQKKAARALLAHEIGAFVAPPGVGKTIVGTYLVAERACSTLVLVHRQPLLDQVARPALPRKSTSMRLARSGRGSELRTAAST